MEGVETRDRGCGASSDGACDEARSGAPSSARADARRGVRGWFARRSVKAAFSLYAAGALVAAIALSALSTSVLGLVAESTLSEDPYAHAGTYVLDAASGSLVPAEALSWYERPAFDALLDEARAAFSGEGSEAAAGADPASSDDGEADAASDAGQLAGDAEEGSGARGGEAVFLYIESASYGDAESIALDDPPDDVRNAVIVDAAQTGSASDIGGKLSLSEIAAYDAAAAAARPGAEAAAELSELLPPNADGDRPVVSNVGYYLPYGGDPQPYRAIANVAIASVPVIFVACFVVAGRLFYRNRIAGPVAAMDAAAKRIADGDLDFALAPQRDDELGRLCGQFETMRGELARSKRAMWRAAENRRRVNAALAHDLRTPLTVIRGRAELVGMVSHDDGVKEAASAILRQADRLARYAESAKSLDSLEDAEIRPEATDSADLLRQMEEGAHAAAAACGVEASCSSEGLPATVSFDAAAFLRVADNLSSNAARHAAARFDVRLSWSAGTLSLFVTDDGHGFGADADRAVEPFWRGDVHGGEAGESDGHLGLGLYICSVLCARCGGALLLADGPEGGARVTATFSVPACDGTEDEEPPCR